MKQQQNLENWLADLTLQIQSCWQKDDILGVKNLE